jgi:signal transduction histidine kinase
VSKAKSHDSSPRDGRLLARFLNQGVVLLDAQRRCCFASTRACSCFGANDQASLVERWGAVHDALALDDLADLDGDGPPLLRTAEVDTPSGVRRLRLEVHAVDDGISRYVMLVRDRSVVDGADGAKVMASECEANRYVIAGLVHDAKGPLNNLHLTLALLASATERLAALPEQQELLARCRRYIGVMLAEETRLTACLHDVHALAERHEPVSERVDIVALLRQAERLLRHEARLRETRIDFASPEHAWSCGDPHRLKLAMLAFCACIVNVARPASTVSIRIDVDADGPIHVNVTGSDIAMPATLTRTLFRLSEVAASDHVAVLAGRTIVEAHGGEVSLVDDGDASNGFSLTLPAASDVALT